MGCVNMRKTIPVFIVALLSGCASVQDANLRQEVLQLSQACRPSPGTSLAEVYKIWDIPVGHSMTTDLDLRAIKIVVGGNPSYLDEVQLMIYIKRDFSDNVVNVVNLDPQDAHVERSELILCNLAPFYVGIDDKKISLPKRWPDQVYLALCHTWLKVLKETIDERKKRLEQAPNP